MGLKQSIIYDMPEAEYHAIEAISSTTLKALEASTPAHVFAGSRPTSEAMELGSAAHCILLQPDKFSEQYYRRPIADGRTKAGKKLIQQASQDNDGKTALPISDWERLHWMRQIVSVHPIVAPLLTESKKEVSIFWEDSFGPCKARFDILSAGCIGDLKTTNNAHPRSFVRDIIYGRSFPGGKRMGPYWVQAAWYWRGAGAVGLDIPEFTFIALELEAPFAISLHTMESTELAGQQERVQQLAETWAECLRTRIYPAYAPVKNLVCIGDMQDA